MFTRAIVIVLDSVGVGELPDAVAYGDEGSNTLGNIARDVALNIPTLAALGLSRVVVAARRAGARGAARGASAGWPSDRRARTRSPATGS